LEARQPRYRHRREAGEYRAQPLERILGGQGLGAPVGVAQRDAVALGGEDHERVRPEERIAGPLLAPLHRLQQEGVGAGPEPQKRRERGVEVGGQLHVDGDQVAVRGECPELFPRGGQRGDAGRGRRHEGRGGQPMASSFFLSWALGTAPTTWSTTAPPLMKRMVGIERIPYRAARAGLSSTFTLARLTLPVPSRASSSRVGAMARQGAHHSAQKSTISTSACLPSSTSKLASVRCRTSSAMSVALLQAGSDAGWVGTTGKSSIKSQCYANIRDCRSQQAGATPNRDRPLGPQEDTPDLGRAQERGGGAFDNIAARLEDIAPVGHAQGQFDVLLDEHHGEAG